MTETTQTEQIEALRDLVQSKGWRVFCDIVLREIAGDFEDQITKALDSPDSTLALDRMRQVAAVRKAGMRWLSLPEQQITSLTASAQHQDQKKLAMVSRRPTGL